MSHEPVNILLLDDISSIQFFVRNALASLPRPYTLHTAGTIAEAMNMIVGVSIDLFIVDIGLPDGDGIDFLCEATMLHPQATALVATDAPTDEQRARAEQLGIFQFISKPLHRDKLIPAVKNLLGWDDDVSPSAPNFRATLNGLTPMDIVQLKCISGATSTVEFSTRHGAGRVYFKRGDIIHAVLRTESGETNIGYKAFEEIVGWKSGRVAEVSDADVPPHTIRANWQSLLLEAAQSHDESAGRAA